MGKGLGRLHEACKRACEGAVVGCAGEISPRLVAGPAGSAGAGRA